MRKILLWPTIKFHLGRFIITAFNIYTAWTKCQQKSNTYAIRFSKSVLSCCIWTVWNDYKILLWPPSHKHTALLTHRAVMAMRRQNSLNRQVMGGCHCDSKLCHFMLTFVFLTGLYCASKVIQLILHVPYSCGSGRWGSCWWRQSVGRDTGRKARPCEERCPLVPRRGCHPCSSSSLAGMAGSR